MSSVESCEPSVSVPSGSSPATADPAATSEEKTTIKISEQKVDVALPPKRIVQINELRKVDVAEKKKRLQVCEYCQTKQEKLFRCTGCKEVIYCSLEHQKSHWSTHKPVCIAHRKEKKRLKDIRKSVEKSFAEVAATAANPAASSTPQPKGIHDGKYKDVEVLSNLNDISAKLNTSAVRIYLSIPTECYLNLKHTPFKSTLVNPNIDVMTSILSL